MASIGIFSVHTEEKKRKKKHHHHHHHKDHDDISSDSKKEVKIDQETTDTPQNGILLCTPKVDVCLFSVYI